MADGPDNFESRGTYKGPQALLKGEKADLICYRATGRCLARFDRLETGYGVGLHDFETASFELECNDEGCPHFGTLHAHAETPDDGH